MADVRMAEPRDVTGLLQAWRSGDEQALERLIPVVLGELRLMAGRQMGGERDGHTLQPTALVNEVYLRLIDLRSMQWQDRAHFLAVAARLMRRVLVDHARARGAHKRGGAAHRVSLDDAFVVSDDDFEDVVAVHEALDRLAAIDERKARVVELRFFGGLNVEETAAVLSVSPETVKRDWRFARVWLMHELETGT